MQTLTVVNLMLGTMGEKPLNSLADSHAMLSAALGKLDETNRSIQSEGWWFNMENVVLTPSVIDKALYLPNDCLEVRVDDRNLTKRGNRVYNLDGGTYEFANNLAVELIREVEFEDVPEVAATFISARAVLAFQTDYDGDEAKSRRLGAAVDDALVWINSAHTRNRKINFLDSNSRLARLKALTYRRTRPVR